MILSIDAENAFHKTQCLLLIKTPQCRDSGNIPQYHNSHLWKAHSKYHCQQGKIESFSPEVRNAVGMSTITTIVQYTTGSPSCSNQTAKGIKGIQIGKEVKISLLQMTWYFMLTCHSKQNKTPLYIMSPTMYIFFALLPQNSLSCLFSPSPVSLSFFLLNTL